MSSEWLTKSIYCAYQRKVSGSYYTIIARCAKTCSRFPCKDIQNSTGAKEMLDRHFEKVVVGISKQKGRKSMYLFKRKGELLEAPEDFDPKNLKDDDIKSLQGVEEVLFVSKKFVPTFKLVPVPMGADKKK